MIELNNILGDGIGSMQLIQQVGSDKMIVNAARVSFGQDNDAPLSPGDCRLINYLVRERHTSPLEHNLLTVKVKAPLSIARQWMRHRVGVSYNEISGRYVTLNSAEFYIPVQLRWQAQSNRQASVDGDYTKQDTELLQDMFRDTYSKSLETYNKLIDWGVAREQARFVLPQGMYTEFYFTCNLASLMHFIKLRDHEGAQWEIQQYAQALRQIAKDYWPMTITAMEGNYE